MTTHWLGWLWSCLGLASVNDLHSMEDRIMGKIDELDAAVTAISGSLAALSEQSAIQSDAITEIGTDLDALIANIPGDGGLSAAETDTLLAKLVGIRESIGVAVQAETAQTDALKVAAAKFSP